MKAMILAAGVGARLRPLTDHRPKALVEIAGRTPLEITLSRLRSFGIREVIINVHHFADLIIDYLKLNNNFGLRIEVSREEALLDTGGGLKKAAWFFLEASNRSENGSPPQREERQGAVGSGPDIDRPHHAPSLAKEGSQFSQFLGAAGGMRTSFEKPFMVHNVDVISTIDLARMAQFHAENNALATLAVKDRETFRYLLFDEQLQLCGRRFGRNGKNEWVRSSVQAQPLAFSGIHIISPRLLTMMTEEGAFSIISTYLRLASQGEKILAFRADEYYWRDLGTPEHVRQAAQEAARFGIRSEGFAGTTTREPQS